MKGYYFKTESEVQQILLDFENAKKFAQILANHVDNVVLMASTANFNDAKEFNPKAN